VHVDPKHLAELKRMAGKLAGESIGGMTDKNKKRLRQFADPKVRQRLLDAPVRAWREVMREPKATWTTLARAEAAIAAAFLTYMPIRLQNLTDLAYDKHLFLRSEPGAKSTLEIPAEEVKNGLEIGFDIPPFVSKMLIEFREVLAPRILGYSPSHVFVKRDGTVKKGPSLRELIQGFMERRVGIEFNPHTFRHLAGKFILDHEPGGHEVVRQVLGHKSLQTTVNFYTGIDTQRAGRHYRHLLEEAIAEQSKPVRRMRRKARRGDGGE
jgi:integrase